jgi:very-short-patch-repair endonuclease
VSEDPVDVVRRLGGHARTQVLLEHTSRGRLAAAVRDGRLLRPRRGLYVLPELPDAAVVAARAGGAVSHASAAEWWRLALVRVPDAVHITVVRGSRRTPLAGVVHHWSPEPIEAADRVTPVLRTVLDCAATMAFDEALAIADSALALCLVDRSALLAAALAGPRTGRGRRLRVARHADGRAANAFESRLRGVVIDAGVTGFEPQLDIELSSGRAVRVDLGDRARRIVLEADSFEHHGSRGALARDCERYDELVASGWIVLRFAWEQVMFRPEWVADVVRRVCRERALACRSSPVRRSRARATAQTRRTDDAALRPRERRPAASLDR